MKSVAALLQRLLPPVWLGMIGAIAIEAQLKFQAPNVTREIGLGIGKLVFTTLNHVELAIALILAIALFTFPAGKRARIIFVSILLILAAQTFWLIPNLVERINFITSGRTPPDSFAHVFYIVFEIGKMILLSFLSVLLNRQSDC